MRRFASVGVTATATATALLLALARPAPAAAQDTAARDTAALDAPDTSGYVTPAPDTADDAFRPADTAAVPPVDTAADTSAAGLPDTAPAAGDTAMPDTASPDTASPDTVAAGDTAGATDPAGVSDTIAADSAAAADTPADTAATGLSEEECEALVRQAEAGGELPPEARGAVVRTWVLPAGTPPSDVRGGTVVLRFRVSDAGRPDPATLEVRGSRDAEYRRRAAEAVRQMQFLPAAVDGCALPSTVELPMHYPASGR